jgi:hypothetical protein
MTLDTNNLKREVQQYAALKEQISQLTKRQSEIKTRLIDTLKEYGEEDSKGHIVLDVNDEVSGIQKLTHQRKVSKQFDEDVAEDILTDKGIYKQCIQVVEVLDEAAIMAAYYQGTLTEADIDNMFPSKVTYAFIA